MVALAPIRLGGPAGPDDDFRAKGASVDLEVFVHDGTGVQPVRDSDPVHPGDRLGFRVTPRRDGYLMVLGFDGVSAYPCWPPTEHADADRISQVLGQVGGVLEEDLVVLRATSAARVQRVLAELAERAQAGSMARAGPAMCRWPSRPTTSSPT